MGDTTSNTQEGYVMLPPASGGPNVRNLQMLVLQPGGTYVNVVMQVVAVSDPTTGIPVDLDDGGHKARVEGLLRAMVRGLEILADINLMPSERGNF